MIEYLKLILDFLKHPSGLLLVAVAATAVGWVTREEIEWLFHWFVNVVESIGGLF